MNHDAKNRFFSSFPPFSSLTVNMDKFLVPQINRPSSGVPIRMHLWDRPAVEVDGRLSREYRHKACQLFSHSCAEMGGLKHGGNGEYCRTNMANDITAGEEPLIKGKRGVTGLEFDSKGVYLACVTKSGCLTVHDFDALYFSMNHPPSSSLKNETSHILHLYEPRTLYGVRWNPENQNEIACSTSCLSGRVICLYDISYISSQPFEMLKRKVSRPVEFTDMAFTSDGRRLIASDIGGNIIIWDRRSSNYPSVELTTNPYTPITSYTASLNSVQLDVENRIIFGAGRMGIIYAWDLRGGRTSYAFQRSNNEVHHPLLASFKLSEKFEKITSLKAQSHIESKQIVSINFDPSCSYQLSFHLRDGWSGVLNTNTFDVTHMHCPPSRENEDIFDTMKKPSWLPSSSIYAVPSHSDIPGIYLLDFHSDPTSACHVDFLDDFEDGSVKSDIVAIPARNKLVQLSEEPLVCTTHPINGTIVAGTELSTLLVISEGIANEGA